MKKLPRSSDCFICGKNNIAGTNVVFISTKDGVECDYCADDKHQSYKGILHGGIISALLDECLGWAVSIKEKRMHVTGELHVRFLRPITIGTKVTVKSFLPTDQDNNKKYRVSTGSIIDDSGNIYAQAEGKFFPISEDALNPILELLEFDDEPLMKVTRDNLYG